VIGVNKYRVGADEKIEVLRVDNAQVLAGQKAKLEKLRASRDAAAVTDALGRLTDAARAAAEGRRGNDLDANLLRLAVDAARAQATVGEISDALEAVYGRHAAQVRTISGVYREEAGSSGPVEEARRMAEQFEEAEGRRPRILVAKMGQDGHDRGQKVIATAFADLGFDVDVGPLFQTPEEVARQAVEADVHVVGVNSLAAGHLTLVPALRDALAELGASDVLVVVGGVIPPDDVPTLKEMGAAAVYQPGTVIAEAAQELLRTLSAGLGHCWRLVGRSTSRPSSRGCGPATGGRCRAPSHWSSPGGPTTGSARRSCWSSCCRTPGERAGSASAGCPGWASRPSSTSSGCG
jgi:methylmalonyl-CoA mutase